MVSAFCYVFHDFGQRQEFVTPISGSCGFRRVPIDSFREPRLCPWSFWPKSRGSSTWIYVKQLRERELIICERKAVSEEKVGEHYPPLSTFKIFRRPRTIITLKRGYLTVTCPYCCTGHREELLFSDDSFILGCFYDVLFQKDCTSKETEESET